MGGSIRDHRDLEVWQRAVDLVLASHGLVKQLPREERWDLGRQVNRAAVSVASNIAEGYGRRTRGDYLRFLAVANGSVKELETQIEILLRLELAGRDEATSVLQLCVRVASMLMALRRSLQR